MSSGDPDGRSVPDVVRDLLRAVLGILRSTARMAGLEAREIAERLAPRIALLVGSVVIAAAGVVVLLGGLALLAERVMGLPRWAGMLLVGVLAVVAGGFGLRIALRRLTDPDLAFPETIAELAKDADALAAPRDEP